MTGKQIVLQGAEEKRDNHSVFSSKRYALKNQMRITELESDTQDTSIYYGTMHVSNENLRVRVEIMNSAQNQAKLSFYNEEEEYFDFLFDVEQQTLVTEEDESLRYQQAQKRYVFLDSEEYHFNIKVT